MKKTRKQSKEKPGELTSIDDEICIGDRQIINGTPIGVTGTLPPQYDTFFGGLAAFSLLVVFVALIL